MSNPLNIPLPGEFNGDTWDGFTWTVSSDETEFAGTLMQAVLAIKNAAGTVVLRLDSDNAGEITLNETAAYLWSITVEPRVLSLTAGVHSWALRLFDDSDTPERRKVTLAGTWNVATDPIN